MPLAQKLIDEAWEHDEDEYRVEHMVASDQELAKGLSRFALRFISEKGLSKEFADVLEEIQRTGKYAA